MKINITFFLLVAAYELILDRLSGTLQLFKILDEVLS
jgi:hypothetical protein